MNDRRRVLENPAIFGLMAVVLLDSFSYAMILPALPFLVLATGGSSGWGGALVGVHALCCAISAPVMGRLSDRYATRPVLLASLFGAIVSYLMLAGATTLVMLFAARALSGAMAGNLAVVQAAVARRTADRERATGMAFFTAAWALGFALGPAVGLILFSSGVHAMRTPALIAAVGTALAALVVGFSDRRPSDAPARATSDIPSPAVRWSKEVRMILLLTAAVAACQTGVVAMTGFFAHDVYGWTQAGVSGVMLACAVTIIAAQMLVVPLASRRIGTRALLIAALAVAVICCIALVLAMRFTALGVIAIVLLFTAIPLVQTTMSTILSLLVAPDQQGKAMGASNGIAAIGRIIGPVVMGLGYGHIGPAAPFGLATIILAACLTVALRLKRSSNAPATAA